MRILIITPSAFPNLTGNAVTTERWKRSLTAKGLSVKVISADVSDSSELEETLRTFRPDLVHVYHAFKAGTLFLKHIEKAGSAPPLVLSPGGTDINLDLESPDKREDILRIMQIARVIVGQSPGIVQRIRESIPESTSKLLSVPKACSWFGHEPFDLRRHTHCSQDAVLFFLPAGIRPIKGNVECLRAMEKVHFLRPQARFVAAGPVIDAAYAKIFEGEIQRLSAFASWLGSIPPARMHAAYISSDIVLNASFSEGLANSLLEALSAGRPFLASDIPGNRHPFFFEESENHAGCYFNPHTPEDFVTKALALIDDEGARMSLAETASQTASRLASPEQEADGLIAAYQRALRAQ
jgi:L-malate glycosyltransferase